MPILTCSYCGLGGIAPRNASPYNSTFILKSTRTDGRVTSRHHLFCKAFAARQEAHRLELQRLRNELRANSGLFPELEA